jgi:predicted transcriptional regulator
MPKDTMFTMKLEAELRDSFMEEAAAFDRPASQIVREFMRDFVEARRRERDHDQWFRAEVEQALREADDPNVELIPHEVVTEKWRRLKAEWAERIAGSDE